MQFCSTWDRHDPRLLRQQPGERDLGGGSAFTLSHISEKVDPVKLNMTLSAAAEALSGQGTKFGQAIRKRIEYGD